MRVILLKDIKKQGKKGKIISVKDGYGNYLINNHLAVLETKGSKKVLNEQKKLLIQEEQQQMTEALKLKKELEKTTLNFKVKVGSSGQVFGSISTKQIVSKLTKNNIVVDKRKIKTDGSLNTLGTNVVTVELYKNIVAKLKVHLEG